MTFQEIRERGETVVHRPPHPHDWEFNVRAAMALIRRDGTVSVRSKVRRAGDDAEFLTRVVDEAEHRLEHGEHKVARVK